MRAFSLAFAVTAALIGRAVARPLVVTPGSAKDLVITSQDTTNGTFASTNATNAPYSNSTAFQAPKIDITATTSAAGAKNLPLSFVNNLSGGSVNAYVTGLDRNNKLVMLQPDGTWYYPTMSGNATTPQPITADVAIPLGAQGSTTNITLPDYISSGRVWFAEGTLQFFLVGTGNGTSLVEPSATNPSDPNADVNWGFVELTNTEDGGLFANISYVDFVGLVLGMNLTVTNGSIQSAQGLQADAVSQICKALTQQASADGQPWDQLCMTKSNGDVLRVIAPSNYLSLYSDAFDSYWTAYLEDVWSKYSNTTLTIDTQGAAGKVKCTATNGTLTCDGDNRSYTKPVAMDIFGCNTGPFAIKATDNGIHQAVVPRLCAALNRSTFLLAGGNIQPGLPSTSYYSELPTNHYSSVVHQYEVDGTGYAFAYDDVTPDGAINQSGVVASANPEVLSIIIGGPS